MKPSTAPKIALSLLSAAAVIFTGSSTNADQVFLDDIIVDGSACIGFDCVNGESFGFDTLRLKENNLRIKFLDTSTSASFPTNDWQLTANDTSNGGAEKFSIDDITGGRTPFTTEAGAPSHSLYVDDGGRLGLGTSTPVSDIHVKSGNTPTLRLEQDGSSGFTPQIWDLAGNEANFFIRDATSGSTLPFRLFPGAPTSALTIEGSTGDIGVGTTSPEADLHIISDATDGILIEKDTLPRFSLENSNVSWNYRLNLNDEMTISQAASGVTEMILDGTTGNVTFAGTVTTATQTLPDYVFEADYDLMPLAELEKFIKENGHLPKVPNQEEVEKAGGAVNLTEMQMRLLEKVEELTLYTLDQQKTIAKLQERLEGLEGK